MKNLTRRQALTTTGLAASSLAVASQLWESSAQTARVSDPFRFSLNTATIMGQNLGIVKEAEIAAKAGYSAIEPWVSSIETYAKSGGSLRDLKNRVLDLGLTIEGAIAFPEWMADDDVKRAKGMEQAKREMDLVGQIGGKRIAAPPVGATDHPGLDLMRAAERYRALLEIGDQIGVVPELELWGFSKNLHRLGECAFVAIETGHPKACILPDIFHLYTGGSDWHGLKLLSSSAIQVLHMNDYPADTPRDKINDSFRTYPGDGTAPLVPVLRLLRERGGPIVLSLELFSKEFWSKDPFSVAKTGLEKMKALVTQALG